MQIKLEKVGIREGNPGKSPLYFNCTPDGLFLNNQKYPVSAGKTMCKPTAALMRLHKRCLPRSNMSEISLHLFKNIFDGTEVKRVNYHPDFLMKEIATSF